MMCNGQMNYINELFQPIIYKNCHFLWISHIYTLLAIKLCDSRFLGNFFDLIHSHFNMYGFWCYLFLYIIKWYVD